VKPLRPRRRFFATVCAARIAQPVTKEPLPSR